MKKNLIKSLKNLLKAYGGEDSNDTNIVPVIDKITEQVKNGSKDGGDNENFWIKAKTEPYTDPETGEEYKRNIKYTDPETGNEYDLLDKTFSETIEAIKNGKTLIVDYEGSIWFLTSWYKGDENEKGSIWVEDTSRLFEIHLKQTDSGLLYAFINNTETGIYEPIWMCNDKYRTPFKATCYAVDVNKISIEVNSPNLVNKGYYAGISFEMWEETNTEDPQIVLACNEDESSPYIQEGDRELIVALMILLKNKLLYENRGRINLPNHWGNSYYPSSQDKILFRYILEHYNLEYVTFYL